MTINLLSKQSLDIIIINENTILEVEPERSIHIFQIGNHVVINNKDTDLVVNKHFVLLKGNEVIVKYVTDIKKIQENKDIVVFGRVLYTMAVE